jgi:sensor histidine kinase YesM
MKNLLSRTGSSALPTTRQVVVVLVVTVLLSWVLHALSKVDFFAVLGRIMFVSMSLLLAYTAAARLRQRWLPQGLVQMLAVGLMAPVASLVTFLLSEGGNVVAYMGSRKNFSGYLAMSIVTLVFGSIVALLALRYERKQRERADRLQVELERNALERELVDARLRLLQAQIEPHFLFNTLANIEALVESGSDKAGPVLRHLIAYLRAAMPRLTDAEATLDTELQLVRAYLELMHMRMPDRLQFALASPPELGGMQFPAMALLTLVENAVRHGIDPGMTGGQIEVGGQRDGATGKVTLWVSDSGVGMSETAKPGMGLANVRTRLQAYYGPSARLDLHEQTPHGLRVELSFHPRSMP